MTNNIEKLYELAEVEKLNKVSIHLNKAYNFEFHETDTKSDFYPPFTAEKQLEIIKWISLNTRYMWNYIGQTVKNTWVLAIDYTQIFKFKSCEHADFSQALAGLVCELWEDLIPEQKEEVRGILE